MAMDGWMGMGRDAGRRDDEVEKQRALIRMSTHQKNKTEKVKRREINLQWQPPIALVHVLLFQHASRFFGRHRHHRQGSAATSAAREMTIWARPTTFPIEHAFGAQVGFCAEA